MKYFPSVSGVLFVFLFSLNGLAQSPNDIVSKWMSEDGQGIIEIFKVKESNKYFGKIVWLKEPLGKDGKPIKDANGNAILNMVNLKDFEFADGYWKDGSVYDPETGKTYYSKLSLENANKLKLRGSVDPMGWIGKTTYWDRVKE